MKTLFSDLRSLDLRAALGEVRGAVIAVGIVTAFLNVLYLAGSIFMMEVYDRVIPSRSGQTLLGLVLIVFIVYFFHAVLEVIRGRILVRIGLILYKSLRPRVYDGLMQVPLRRPPTGDPLAPLKDADQVRNFVGGAGLATLFDLPFLPFYLTICYLFHPLIGLTATIGALILISLTVLSEWLARYHNRIAQTEGALRTEITIAAVRNAESVKAMGMQPALLKVINAVESRYIASFREMGDIIGGLSSISRVVRIALQSAVLGVGAYLVIDGRATAGIIIASSILSSRALSPVEQAIGNWKGFMAARSSWERLNTLLKSVPPPGDKLRLPPPRQRLELTHVSAAPPGMRKATIQNIHFTLAAGSGLGVVGPSASGKSTLVRVIVGAWATTAGSVRLDGAEIDQWRTEDIGQHIGYLPQMVELFSGTVAQNIARFDPEPDEAAILKAASAAGIHELILSLADGYETQIGPGGAHLSAGQRQRVALARALYRDPFLVVLDEPNSNLDLEGERALINAIRSVRARGGIVIIVAHHGAVLSEIDTFLVISQGKMLAYGPKEDVMRIVNRRKGAPAPQPAPSLEGQEGRGTTAIPDNRAGEKGGAA